MKKYTVWITRSNEDATVSHHEYFDAYENAVAYAEKSLSSDKATKYQILFTDSSGKTFLCDFGDNIGENVLQCRRNGYL